MEPDNKQRKPLSWRRRILWTAATLLLALLVAEVALRTLGSVVMRRQLASGSAEGAFTILCVGDSWTQGAPYGRYPDFLEQRLEAERPGLDVRIVNVGSAGTNSSQALRRMADAMAEAEPDLIVAMTGNNDHHNLTASSYWRFQDRELGSWDVAAAGLRSSLHASRVYRLVRATWQKGRGAATTNEFFAREEEQRHRDLIAIDRETHRKQLRYNLIKIVELARNHETPIVFQTYFHFHGYHVNEVIRDTAARHDVPLADHNYVFHTDVPPEERPALRIEDGHPNRDGYALMAETLAATLRQARLVP